MRGVAGVAVAVPLPSRTEREGREATARDASEVTSEVFSFGKWSPSSTVTGRTNLYLQEDKMRENGNHGVKHDNQQNKQTFVEFKARE